MGLSRTISEINGDFSRKSKFNTPDDGFPLELGNIGWLRETRTRMMWLSDSEERLMIYSRLDTIHECQRQTDRQQPTAGTAFLA